MKKKLAAQKRAQPATRKRAAPAAKKKVAKKRATNKRAVPVASTGAAPAASPPAANAPAAVPPAARQVKIRMYNVGFGDSLLLWVPTAQGERRILVDCGFHSQGKGKFSDRDLVNRIKEDLDGQPINVLIATHRHQDHISGFGETDLWADVGIEEIWLPFTAGSQAAHDEPALRLWNGLMDSAHALVNDAGALTSSAAAAMAAHDPAERAAAAFMLWNARSNAPAIDNLLTGMRGPGGRPARRRFLPEEKDKYPSKIDTPALPGIVIHVLGPPTDPKARRNREVPSSWGLAAAGPGAVGGHAGQSDRPFSDEWRIPDQRLPSRKPFQNKTLQSIRLLNDDLFYAARAIDGFLNGESLVLVMEVGNARLLFPGDAEVGAWNTIMANPKALELASGATFLKVGHHGSHNATPITFIDHHLAEKTPAVISTQEGPGNYRNGIPLPRLLTRLDARRMPYARSDDPPKRSGSLFKPDPQGRWVDCLIAC
ncbi:MAG: MBL fold metallo-hydrolase [Mycobacterium sp.]|nr:MBL fold metallo-hydrolase [Mycobacterium sp.]